MCTVNLTAGFPRVFLEKRPEERPEERRFKGHTKAEELRSEEPGSPATQPLSGPYSSLGRAVSQEKLGGNSETEGAPRGQWRPLKHALSS